MQTDAHGAIMFKAAARFQPADGTLLLPVEPVDLAPPDSPLLVEGIRYSPKSELHVTVIGRSVAEALASEGVDAEAVQALLQRLPRSWRIQRLDRWWRLHDRQREGAEGARGRLSLIQEVQCPEARALFAGLKREVGSFSEPPLHITWYVRGDAEGIALPDMDTLDRLGTRLSEAI